MSSFHDILVDFGDDDDADEFLTGKLSALGIDEDLELSGGEEEEVSEDRPSAAAAAAASPPPSASPEHPSPPAVVLASPPPEPSSTTPAAAAAAAAATTTEDRGKAPTSSAEVANNKALWQTSAGKRNEACPPPAAAAAGGGGEAEGGGGGGGDDVEDGEIMEMLKKPLQAPRGRPKQQQRQRGSRDNIKNGRSERGRNVTIKECAKWMCACLGEPKYYLMCRVVSTIGYTRTRGLLESVQEIQDGGGMATADGSRKRSAGGVFFTLLKDHMEPAKLKELYADEVRVKKEKERARRAANKRKALAALAGEDVMTPRDPPRKRAQGTDRGGGGGGSATRAGRDMGTWVSPNAARERT